MNVNELMAQKAITKYRLSPNSGVPYTTVCDICNGKTKYEKITMATDLRTPLRRSYTRHAAHAACVHPILVPFFMDICAGKWHGHKYENCSVKTVYKIAEP